MTTQNLADLSVSDPQYTWVAAASVLAVANAMAPGDERKEAKAGVGAVSDRVDCCCCVADVMWEVTIWVNYTFD